MTPNTDRLSALSDQYESSSLSFTLGLAEFYSCRRLNDGAAMLGVVFDLSQLEPDASAEITDAAQFWLQGSFGSWYPINIHSVSNTLFVVMMEDPGGVSLLQGSGELLPVHPIRATQLSLAVCRSVMQLVEAGVDVFALPPHLLRELSGGTILILHAWLLPIMPALLRLGSSEATSLPATIAPEEDNRRASRSRLAVFAVGSLLRQLLVGWSSGTLLEGRRIALHPGLERVLGRATSQFPYLRTSNLVRFAQELIENGPANHSKFIPIGRQAIPPRQQRFVTRPRPYLPSRSIQRIPEALIRPWMVLCVLVVGITIFLALTPRFDNPLAPLEETLVELRSAFSNTEPYMPTGSMGLSTRDLLFIPDFTGLQQAEVQIEASNLKLDIAIEEDNISDVAAGTVIRQDPAPGSRIRPGNTITLVVGSGESSAFLIAVENRTALDAREALNGLGFVVVEVPTFDPDRPAGIVVGQSPEPGQVLPKGSQVVVEVSHGVQRITIPSVVGLSESDALRIGTDLGLNVAIEQVQDASLAYQPGEVVSQQPGAGSSVELGTTVILRVYDPRPVIVPDLRGLNLEQALIALDQAELATGIVQKLPAQETQSLLVISQSPVPGSPTVRYAVVDFQLGPR